MMTSPFIGRRDFLMLGGAALAVPLLARDAFAQLETDTPLHGISPFGDLKYGPDFEHFDYVNPDAPKGGRLSTQLAQWSYNQAPDTFDTLNAYVLRGNGAAGMGLTFATLMLGSADEMGAYYGYAAESVTVSEDRLTWRFRLRPEAVFHDGTPITADDVAFSIEILRDEGHENLASTLRQIEEIAAIDDHTLSVRILPTAGISTVFTFAAGCPIMSRAWWEGRTFDATLSEGPLGSGPYRVGRFNFGTFIEFDRVDNDWAADLPVMRGRYNFDRLRYDYFRDRNASFEAFKAGVILFREEFTSRNWATDYNFPALLDGRVKQAEVPDETPSAGQAWFFNTRRDKFSDPRVRQAIGLLFDFEWTNANIMFNSFERSMSFFEMTEHKAEGLPDEAELALLEPFREELPEAVFEEPYVPPVSDGSGRIRERQREAITMLEEAGCTREGGRLVLPSGERLTIEFLNNSQTFEPHHNAFIRNLQQVGIEASFRIVDASQYALRTRQFDFDMIVSRHSMSPFPSRGIRQSFGSETANAPGSLNLAGVAHPAVDAILDKIIAAESWDEFRTANRALDRILRAQHYYVFQWYKPSRWLAFWDHYDRPAISPRFGHGVLDTWWTRPDQIRATGITG
jgi:microcin C transport system substrate-binding protein